MQPGRLLCPWDSPGKNTRVGCHSLLHGSSGPREWTRVSCIAGRVFTTEPPGKPRARHRWFKNGNLKTNKQTKPGNLFLIPNKCYMSYTFSMYFLKILLLLLLVCESPRADEWIWMNKWQMNLLKSLEASGFTRLSTLVFFFVLLLFFVNIYSHPPYIILSVRSNDPSLCTHQFQHLAPSITPLPSTGSFPSAA